MKKNKFEEIFGPISANVPHPTGHVVSELPGLALASGKFDGFGSKICIPVEAGSELFENPENSEDSENTEDSEE